MKVFKIYNPKQKNDYRKLKHWKIRVNVSNNYYKNEEHD
jgi:hypothetical protein